MAKIVLVIDDDPDVCETLSLRLETFGYQMVSAANGTIGIAKAEEIKPDLIFLDYTMPGESGFEVLKKLKSETSEAVRKIPVVMLTGNEQYEKQCLEAGAQTYLTKPFDLFRLKQILSRFLATP